VGGASAAVIPGKTNAVVERAMRLRERLVFKGPSEQDYGHSAGVCRALLLGVVRREWPHPWQVRQRRGGARQALPKGAYSQSRSRRCTDLKGRHLTAPVRLDSRIGCRPERS
ncbi:MAG TPA: hypothetical protein QGF41_09090, partial [Gammaproteobacteria bacterium]|nr:hypothetical protein [Gammaproteobacteria bacterium]